MVDAATWESVAAIIEGDLGAKGVKAEVVGIRDGVVTIACDKGEVALVRYDTQRLGALVAKTHPEIKRVSVIGRENPVL
jgi:hypothetical protein